MGDSSITWVFDDGFVPTAKLTKDGSYSIICDHLGTPVESYDENGECVWTMELDIYGRVIRHTGDVDFVSFRFQGQYVDLETNLYYNRFRYYDPEVGQYIQQDPIGLEGGNPTLYGYVGDTNTWVDPFGLSGTQNHHIIPRSVWRDSPFLQQSGLGVDDLANRVDLPRVPGGDPLHPNSSAHNGWRGAHPAYNEMMRTEVARLEARARQNNWSPERTQREINRLQNRIKNGLQEGTILCH